METSLSPHNRVLPFMLAETNVRGRIVRLENVAHEILRRHDYPPIVSDQLAQMMLIATMLATSLQAEGILTLQIKGDGAVRLMVVDVMHGGGLRGYAEMAADNAAHVLPAQLEHLHQLFGENSYLAITLDPGAGMQRYQGIVGLEGTTIAEAVSGYFTHSQQIDVAFHLSTSRSSDTLVAAGMMIERMPDHGGLHAKPRVEDKSDESEDDWRYASVMLRTLREGEIISADVSLEEILTRLYHEQGVIVYDAVGVHAGCRCSRERILQLLLSMSAQDRLEMLIDAQASVHCQFCNKTEFFTPAELELAAQ